MIPVRLKSRNAEIVGYALLDNGSDVTLINSNCLKSLELNEDQASVVVETVDGNRTMKVTSAPSEIYSLDRSEHVTIEEALVVANIPGHKPTKSAMNNLVKWPHLSDVPIDVDWLRRARSTLSVKPTVVWKEEPVRCEKVAGVDGLWICIIPGI
ncbi:unnamed protein product [Schistosoma margrebowiei]|uniref:Uncharacterized protein n=1 Tax=Schistosoma margrebowiei TaxID=48269 RepID=A0A183N584_9TREM|nr:unnamed protein product [Schistosoma margrebowiei]